MILFIMQRKSRKKLAREHVVRIGDILHNFNEVDSVVIEVNFKDGSTIAYESESKKVVSSLSDSEVD